MLLHDKKRAGVMSRKANNQDGFVLVLTMVMLVVLSVLGVTVLNTTNTELSITTNSRMNNDAFVAAELATQYAQQKVINDYSTISEILNYDLATEDPIKAILPSGITFTLGGKNEVDFYTGIAPTAMLHNTSTDAYQSNIYRTNSVDGAPSDSNAAYYRVSVDIKARGRSSARVESLFVNIGGHVF